MPGLSQDQMGDARRCQSDAYGYTAYACGVCVNPATITVGADNNIWSASLNSTTDIFNITTHGTVHTFGAPGTHVDDMTLGPDGKVWVSTAGGSGGVIASISTAGKLSKYALANGGYGYNITVGSDGNLWYSDRVNSLVGMVTTSGSFGKTISIANNGWTVSTPDPMTSGRDGNLWLVRGAIDGVTKITLAGGVSIIPLQAGARPSGVATGPDSNLWITEFAQNTIARVTPGGTVTEWTGSAIGINSSASPIGITTGPDGNIWFAETGSNSIGKFVL